ncbi:MAG: hypothetical protein J5637_05565 [Prevotella sp.]|nr:hypothetical protein [Prevotella sp.]
MNKNYRIVVCLTLCLVALCVLMLSRIHRRMILSIEGFDLPIAEEVTVGRQSGVCFDKIPRHFLKVTRDGDGFTWQVNDECLRSDSLCYFKVNNSNPNLHALHDGQVIEVAVESEKMSLSIDKLRELMGHHNSQYVLLRNLLEKQYPGKGFIDRRDLRSFLYREKKTFGYGPWQLVILDRSTTLTGDGQTVGYATNGHADRYCKIQFFRMAEYCFKESGSGGFFTIDGVSYMAKPVLLTTAWGAGHVMLQAEGNTTKVRFPKPLTYTEDCDTLMSLAGHSSSLLTLQQSDGSMPLDRSLYLPAFSTNVRQEVAHVSVFSDSIMVEDHRLATPFLLLPSLQRMEVDGGVGKVVLQVGTINVGFVLSYLWLPLMVFLVIFFAYPRLVDVRKVNIVGKSEWADRLPWGFRMVVTIAFAYGVARMMIALKLSWTYPYFEKLTGMIVPTVGLMLTLLFCLSLLFNHDFLTTPRHLAHKRKSQWHRWVAVAIAVVLVALCGLALRHADQHFSREVLRSYMPGEVFSANVLHWSELSGVNDLHRSVPYTLLLFNLLAIVALVLRNFWRPRLKARPMVWAQRQSERLTSRWPWMTAMSRYVNLPSAILVLLLCAAVAAVSVLPGNFSTVFITLLVVFGLSWSLMQVDFSQGRLWAFAKMLLLSLLFLGAAILMPTADKGYFTNYLGIVLLTITFYLIAYKYQNGSPNSREYKANERERRWVVAAVAGVLALAVLAPNIISAITDADEVDYSRSTRRFHMFSQFEKYRDSGYRYAVSDTEFMTVMMHYMYNTSGADPLSPERHMLHPSVSTGQSPVVLNDVSLQAAFFGTYGLGAYVVYFGLLVLLAVALTLYNLPRSISRGSMPLDVRLVWRLLAMMMWVGTSVYLYCSYTGHFPFTGRLNPGLGVDSVGEALESTLLLAVMTATRLTRPDVRYLR